MKRVVSTSVLGGSLWIEGKWVLHMSKLFASLGSRESRAKERKREGKEEKRTRRALFLPFLPTNARDVVYVRFALRFGEAVVVGEVFRVVEAAMAVFVEVESGRFAVDVHESLSFREEGWCCEGRQA